MTDESHTNEPPAPQEGQPSMPEPAAEETSTSPMSMGDFTSAQGMVALGGLILIVVWLIFDVIIEEYGVPRVALLLAATAAILPRLNRDSFEKVHPLPILMKMIGYGLALLGVFVIVEEVVGGVLGRDAGTIIGALLAYAGYVVAFMGARSIED